jgi:hypothetical protein
MPQFSALMTRVSIIVLAVVGMSACASAENVPIGGAPGSVHLFSEGYLQMVGATDTTATRGADGVWRVATVKGVPENWSKPTIYRLGRKRAAALEAILDSPTSYLDDPGPDPNQVCLDPWSMRIEWFWRSKRHVIAQDCGPWGVADKIRALLR